MFSSKVREQLTSAAGVHQYRKRIAFKVRLEWSIVAFALCVQLDERAEGLEIHQMHAAGMATHH